MRESNEIILNRPKQWMTSSHSNASVRFGNWQSQLEPLRICENNAILVSIFTFYSTSESLREQFRKQWFFKICFHTNSYQL